ncbi:polysaccharide deacetylase family protein [Afifella sp. IM 167]|uniref:polysaccharide deacetylase family protein n=1 Tax=Afifella sp. IM 167 TaxID=2033586 RepID=UPI001CCCB7E0|nr:polysaccharide deacetylase family protein [Afifella sp. IM 167]MBZ8134950.1 hypothetical protein [Afifella sp. IM 167]
MERAEILRRLGLDPARRAAILHEDDAGMCHGANTAFVELSKAGALTSGSVMVPCPWFPEMARLAYRDDSLDLGIHLTLTSEWAGYRWGPLTRAGRASGLVDEEGYFHRTVAALGEKVEPEAAEAEMRAQIERARAFDIDATHIDTHMGAALHPRLAEIYFRLGEEYRLPVLLPKRAESYARVLKYEPDEVLPIWSAAAERLEEQGVPLVDDFDMTPGVASADSEAAYRRLVEELPEGLTFVALHPNAPGDIETIVPPRAHFRTDEYRLLGEGRMAEWLEAAGVQTLGMRPLRELYRENLARRG